MSDRIYALPLHAHKAHGIDVSKICWGSCGKGSIGAISLGSDEAIPCVYPAAECPAFEKEMGTPCGTVDFNGREYEIVLRKLAAPRSPSDASKETTP